MRVATPLRPTMRSHLLAAALAATVASPAAAQVIVRGMVVDDSSARGIALAEVVLLTHYMDPLARVRSDSTGAFTFGERAVGWYRLQVRRIGFAEVTTPPVELTVDRPVSLQIHMRPRAPLLAPLVVVRQRARPTNFIEDFEYRRALRTAGMFLGPAELANMGSFYAPDLVRRVPGGRVVPNEFNIPSVYFGRDNGQFEGIKCNPVFYLDGLRLTSDRERALMTGRLGQNLDDSLAARADTAFVRNESNVPMALTMLSVADIHGVEVYRGASQVPIEFMDPFATCGVMAIWTKYGRR